MYCIHRCQAAGSLTNITPATCRGGEQLDSACVFILPQIGRPGSTKQRMCEGAGEVRDFWEFVYSVAVLPVDGTKLTAHNRGVPLLADQIYEAAHRSQRDDICAVRMDVQSTDTSVSARRARRRSMRTYSSQEESLMGTPHTGLWTEENNSGSYESFSIEPGVGGGLVDGGWRWAWIQRSCSDNNVAASRPQGSPVGER